MFHTLFLSCFADCSISELDTAKLHVFPGLHHVKFDGPVKLNIESSWSSRLSKNLFFRS